MGATSGSSSRSPARALLLAAASVLLPGLAHLVAGRRRAAAAIAGTAAAVVVVLVAVAFSLSRADLLRLAVRPDALAAVSVASVVLAAAVVALVLRSYLVLHPAPTRRWSRTGSALVVGVLCAAVAVPPLTLARYASVQSGLVTSVFPDTPAPADPLARGAPSRADPWGGRTRLNVLLLASDADPGRYGTRTDSLVLASVDVSGGDVLLVALPRSLRRAPMPAGPLRRTWPQGFPDLINALYNRVTETPGLLAGERDRGAAAVKAVVGEILGLPVDYYLMANLAGFERFVDALGGVTVTVRERLPIGGLLADGTRVPPTGYLEPGTRRLSGVDALWYARSRRDSTDYDRMERQRCLIGALVRQADPVTVLRNFTELASATRRLVSTDIPRGRLGDLVLLAGQVRAAGQVRSLQLVPPGISTVRPDYPAIRSAVRRALAEPAGGPPGPTGPPAVGEPAPPGPGGPVSGPAAPSGRRAGARLAVESVDRVC